MATIDDIKSFCSLYGFHGYHAKTGHPEWERFYLHHGNLQIGRFSIHNGQVYSVKWYAHGVKYARAMIAWAVYEKSRHTVGVKFFMTCWREAIAQLEAKRKAAESKRTALDLDRAMQGLGPKNRQKLAPITNERIFHRCCEIVMQMVDDERSRTI